MIFELLLAVVISLQQTSEEAQNPSKSQTICENVPEDIVLKECKYGYGMFASKSFKAGEVLYKQRYYTIGNEEKEYLLKTNQGDFILTTSTHSVIMGKGKRALYTFDSFINYSCDPNTYSLNTPAMIESLEYFSDGRKRYSGWRTAHMRLQSLRLRLS